MLTGSWGMGKTCFYNFSLKNILQSDEPFSHCPIIEISCFGIKSIDDLVVQILNHVFFLEFLSIVGNYAKQLISSSTNFKKWLIPDNLLIVIDDFERVYPKENFHIELLGLVDYLIRIKHCHVLIICNEKKLISNNSVNNDFYSDFREKIIHREHFSLTLDVVKKILTSYTTEFQHNEYHFDQQLIERFVELAKKIENFRIIEDTIVDMREAIEKLINVISKTNLPQKEQEENLQKYFTEDCASLIKALLIKNAGKEEAYAEFQAVYKAYLRDKSDKKQKPIPTDAFLKNIGEIKLSGTDNCLIETGLAFYDDTWPDILEKGIEALNDGFYNELIESILFNDLIRIINSCKEAITEENAITNIQAAFVRVIKFMVETIPLNGCKFEEHIGLQRLRLAVWYLLFIKKFEIKLPSLEQELFIKLENCLTKEKIYQALKNMKGISSGQGLYTDEFDAWFRGKAIDPNCILVSSLLDEYKSED